MNLKNILFFSASLCFISSNVYGMSGFPAIDFNRQQPVEYDGDESSCIQEQLGYYESGFEGTYAEYKKLQAEYKKLQEVRKEIEISKKITIDHFRNLFSHDNCASPEGMSLLSHMLETFDVRTVESHPFTGYTILDLYFAFNRGELALDPIKLMLEKNVNPRHPRRTSLGTATFVDDITSSLVPQSSREAILSLIAQHERQGSSMIPEQSTPIQSPSTPQEDDASLQLAKNLQSLFNRGQDDLATAFVAYHESTGGTLESFFEAQAAGPRAEELTTKASEETQVSAMPESSEGTRGCGKKRPALRPVEEIDENKENETEDPKFLAEMMARSIRERSTPVTFEYFNFFFGSPLANNCLLLTRLLANFGENAKKVDPTSNCSLLDIYYRENWRNLSPQIITLLLDAGVSPYHAPLGMGSSFAHNIRRELKDQPLLKEIYDLIEGWEEARATTPVANTPTSMLTQAVDRSSVPLPASYDWKPSSNSSRTGHRSIRTSSTPQEGPPPFLIPTDPWAIREGCKFHMKQYPNRPFTFEEGAAALANLADNIPLLEALLKTHIRAQGKDPETQRTYLHALILSPHREASVPLELVRLLLKHGAQPTAPDHLGYSFIWYLEHRYLHLPKAREALSICDHHLYGCQGTVLPKITPV